MSQQKQIEFRLSKLKTYFEHQERVDREQILLQLKNDIDKLQQPVRHYGICDSGLFSATESDKSANPALLVNTKLSAIT